MSNMTNVPLFSARSVNASPALHAAVESVLASQWYILGKEVDSFEQVYARWVGAERCISVANGTDALELALRGLGIATDDRVVTVANAGFYGSTAIHAVGAVPLYADVEDGPLTLCPHALQRALQLKPQAIIVTHLYGQLANMGELASIAGRAGIPIVEDCAQAHGAQLNGQKAGSFGAVSCFSFYPTKNLGALGDGGAVVTNDAALADRVRSLRQYGWSSKYHVGMQGGRNSRLDEIQAAVLNAKLPHVHEWNRQRRDVARRYNEAFNALPLRCPASLAEDYVAHLYVIRTDQRDALRAHLAARGVATDVHYPIPDHLQSAYTNHLCADDLAVTTRASATVVSLPCFPGISDEEVEYVIKAVKEFFA